MHPVLVMLSISFAFCFSLSFSISLSLSLSLSHSLIYTLIHTPSPYSYAPLFLVCFSPLVPLCIVYSTSVCVITVTTACHYILSSTLLHSSSLVVSASVYLFSLSLGVLISSGWLGITLPLLSLRSGSVFPSILPRLSRRLFSLPLL